MESLHQILKDLLLGTEFLAAVIGLYYFFKLKNSYWKWFSAYLLLIFLQELFFIKIASSEIQWKSEYYMFFGVPLEYLFFYWLYALKSLKKRILFWVFFALYLASILLSTLYTNLEEIHSLSSNIALLTMIVLLILEFIKQVKTDDILTFKENKMFYINLGLILFYVVGYPYHVFGKELYENYEHYWDMYRVYFLLSNSSMYLLFAASFIWGKTR